MFNKISEKIGSLFDRISGSVLTEKNITSAVDEIKEALIQADVSLDAINNLMERIIKNATGKSSAGVTPGQQFIKIVNDEFVSTLLSENNELNLRKKKPIVIVLAGLQGAGKTTTAAKLAKLIESMKMKTLLVSVDTQRPAAIEQLKILAKNANVAFFDNTYTDPVTIAKESITYATRQIIDVVIIDTAGRLHIDEDMMQQAADIINALDYPKKDLDLFFCVDGMMGQDAANTAKTFSQKLPLTGIIVTKMDTDSSGGAILSVKYIVKKPIMFICTGEALNNIKVFDAKEAEDTVSRILGDKIAGIVRLAKAAAEKIDKKQAEAFVNKLQKGGSFNFNDMKNQLEQLNRMGGMSKMAGKMSGMFKINPEQIQESEKTAGKMLAIISSMTHMERIHPALVLNNLSRKNRVALGSGVKLNDINMLFSQFDKMKKLYSSFGKMGSISGMLKQIKNKFGINPEDFEGGL